MTKEKNWKVNIDRPEEIHGKPELYYTNEEVEKYSRSGGIKKTQEKIALRIVELIKLKEGSKILDLGCGPGYTTEIYKNEGYDVIGIDIIKNMLEKARQKGLNVIEGDMRNLKELFREKEFDAVVSVSALQWINEKKDIEKIASGINHVLKEKGKIAMQFYPKSRNTLLQVGKIFKNTGFEGKIITDNPDKPIKRIVYIVMKKV